MAPVQQNPSPPSARSRRAFLRSCAGLAAAGFAGSTFTSCTPDESGNLASQGSAASAASDDAEATSPPPPDELQAKLDSALDFTCHNRRLNLKDHAAWQIVHGALAFGRDFQITDHDGKDVSAIDYLLAGGRMTGWTMERGVQVGDPPRAGLRAVVEAGSKTGQGHADQWLGYLADVGLKLDQEITAAGEKFTIEDYLLQMEHDVPYNVEQEYSWTVMALTAYRPTSYSWTAGDEKTWTIEQLMQIEVDHELATSACGGSHRMAGIVMALNQHKRAGGELTGAWKAADEKIRDCVSRARQFQNPDGSLSTNWFERPGNAPDIRERLGCTGHVLEFVVLASTDEELKQPWIERAVAFLCGLLEKTRRLDLECGALYHAAHGLVLYRQRRFGMRTYTKTTA